MRHLLYDRDKPLRHGHMVGIDDRCMEEGMAADYVEIARLTERVNDIVREARSVEVQAPSGTDMRATLDPSRLRWHPCPGIYHEPGTWGNLPEGETYTSPASLQGVLGAEVIGDYFSERYGLLEPPLRLEIDAGRVRKGWSTRTRSGADVESLPGSARERQPCRRARDRHQHRAPGALR